MTPAPPLDSVNSAAHSVQDIAEHCRTYKGAKFSSALFQLGSTTALFLAAMVAAIYGFHHGMALMTAGMMLLAGGLLVRLFIVQHDCGHGSFFATRAANDMTGRVLSLLTFTPYDVWRRSHNLHHASSGNLTHRGVGSIDTLTVKEYNALGAREKLYYRIYRNPFILLVLATPIYVILVQRYPSAPALPYFADYKHLPVSQTWKSVVGLDIALLAFYGALSALIGWQAVLFVCIPVVVITSWVGGWLFFIQHQFEDGYWEYKQDWNFHEAALHGSSYYVLPKILQWFSGNIGLHHIHHLCPAIPNYKLQECLDANSTLQTLNRMTLRDSLRCLNWALWCEDRKKMISFREMKTA